MQKRDTVAFFSARLKGEDWKPETVVEKGSEGGGAATAGAESLGGSRNGGNNAQERRESPSPLLLLLFPANGAVGSIPFLSSSAGADTVTLCSFLHSIEWQKWNNRGMGSLRAQGRKKHHHGPLPPLPAQIVTPEGRGGSDAEKRGRG